MSALSLVGWIEPDPRCDANVVVEGDEWEPEEYANHLIYPDPQDCVDFNITPGTALCGYVFTTQNDLGPASSVAADPRFVLTEECQRCVDVADTHRLVVDIMNSPR